MNKFIGIGNISRDVDIRHTNDGTAIARFSVALNRRDKEGGADFINCVAFGSRAENIDKYFHKGSKIAFTARVQTGSYESKNGGKVYTTDFIVEDFEFVEKKQDNGIADNKQQDNGFVSVPESVDEEGLPWS